MTPGAFPDFDIFPRMKNPTTVNSVSTVTIRRSVLTILPFVACCSGHTNLSMDSQFPTGTVEKTASSVLAIFLCSRTEGTLRA